VLEELVLQVHLEKVAQVQTASLRLLPAVEAVVLAEVL